METKKFVFLVLFLTSTRALSLGAPKTVTNGRQTKQIELGDGQRYTCGTTNDGDVLFFRIDGMNSLN